MDIESLKNIEIVLTFKVADINIKGLNKIEVLPIEIRKEGIKKEKIIPERIDRKYMKYTAEQKDYMANSGQGNNYLAKRFKTTSNKISKIKYQWRNNKKRHKYKLNKGTPTSIPAVPADE